MIDEPSAVISVENISKWYGSVVAVNDVSFQIEPGVTGLLGPNGAGKTTLLKMIEGLSDPSDGAVSIFGQPPRGNPDLYRRVGIMSEHEAVYGFYTGREFVEFSAKLHGVTSVAEAADLAIERAGMTEAQGRKLGGYSRGMRQRMRLAAAMVHQPEVLILDEPLNGTDPRQRIEFHDLMRQLATEESGIWAPLLATTTKSPSESRSSRNSAASRTVMSYSSSPARNCEATRPLIALRMVLPTSEVLNS